MHVKRDLLVVSVIIVLVGTLSLAGTTPVEAAGRSVVGATNQPVVFGDASTYGQVALSARAYFVGMASTPDSHGYWLAGADGGVFAYGDAGFFGSATNLNLDQPIVGIAATPDGKGYWLTAADGGVFAYGDAQYFGSANTLQLQLDVVGISATPDGSGYWLIAADGGVFAYGDAGFFGSGVGSSSHVFVGMASTPNGKGYWITTATGTVIPFGNAMAYGSLVTSPTHYEQIVGIASTSDGDGYWLVGSDGGVFAYGDAGFFGSAGNDTVLSPVVALAPTHDGKGYWILPEAPLAPANVPVLACAREYTEGFGLAAPSFIFLGGDPTGAVYSIQWQSWGGPEAVGTGYAEYVPPGEYVYEGYSQPATVVAFDLGNVDGQLMYQQVEWYFPGLGETFDPSGASSLCPPSPTPV